MNYNALKACRLFLLDMDGTLYLGDEVFPGAVDFIRTLENTGRRYIYLTNNSSRAGVDYVNRLRGLGFPCEMENVFTSGMATGMYLMEKYPGVPVYPVGTPAFLDELRSLTQVIIISDTFEQFAKPLMEKLGWPTLFCNELVVAEDGTITDFAMRCPETKLTTVRALHSCGMQTIAAGDSHNDLGMILDSKAGFLFRTTDAIKAEYPELPALETYDELLAAIKDAL